MLLAIILRFEKQILYVLFFIRNITLIFLFLSSKYKTYLPLICYSESKV